MKYCKIKSLLSVLLLGILLLLIGCGEDDSPTESGGTSISGTVKIKATQQPVNGAKVSMGDQLLTATDASGNFKLLNVPTVEQAFRVEKAGYAVFIEDYTPMNGENNFNVELETHVEYCNRVSSVEYKGRTYNTVLIGEQCWFKENLNVGNRIDYDEPQTNNTVVEKYCESNRVANCDEYGGLYQWEEAMNYIQAFSNQGICPDGWHVPEYAAFVQLGAFVEEDANTLKAEGLGEEPDGVGTNTSGWTGLMGGLVSHDKGDVYSVGYGSDGYWSSDEQGDNQAKVFGLWESVSNALYSDENKVEGLSIRCLKD